MHDTRNLRPICHSCAASTYVRHTQPTCQPVVIRAAALRMPLTEGMHYYCPCYTLDTVGKYVCAGSI